MNSRKKKIFVMISVFTLVINLFSIVHLDFVYAEQEDVQYNTMEVGAYNGFAIDKNGDLWGWGAGINGISVDLDNYIQDEPVKVVEGYNLVAVNSSYRYNTVLNNKGEVFEFEYNDDIDFISLKKIEGLNNIVQVESTDNASFDSNELYVNQGLARDEENNVFIFGESLLEQFATTVVKLEIIDIIDVACEYTGEYECSYFILDNDNRVYSVSTDYHNMDGTGELISINEIDIPTDTTIVDISNNYGLDSEGNIWKLSSYTLDSYQVYQLVNIDKMYSGLSEPIFISKDGFIKQIDRYSVKTIDICGLVDESETLIDISYNGKVLTVLTSKGELYSLGDNSNGVIGYDLPLEYYELNEVTFDENIKEIECAFSKTLILKEDGKLYGVGENRASYGRDLIIDSFDKFFVTPQFMFDGIEKIVGSHSSGTYALDYSGNIVRWRNQSEYSNKMKLEVFIAAGEFKEVFVNPSGVYIYKNNNDLIKYDGYYNSFQQIDTITSIKDIDVITNINGVSLLVLKENGELYYLHYNDYSQEVVFEIIQTTNSVSEIAGNAFVDSTGVVYRIRLEPYYSESHYSIDKLQVEASIKHLFNNGDNNNIVIGLDENDIPWVWEHDLTSSPSLLYEPINRYGGFNMYSFINADWPTESYLVTGIKKLTTTKISDISIGESHAIFKGIDGNYYGLGFNQFGQLANGSQLGIQVEFKRINIPTIMTGKEKVESSIDIYSKKVDLNSVYKDYDRNSDGIIDLLDLVSEMKNK